MAVGSNALSKAEPYDLNTGDKIIGDGPWELTESSKNYVGTYEDGKSSQLCSTERDMDNNEFMIFKANTVYKVQSGYKIWSTDETKLIAEADGIAFEQVWDY